MLDVAIIGCGVIGAAAAYELSHYPLQTAIFEAENDVADCTTKANSAILHAGYDPEPGTRMARLNVEGSALAKEICARLDVPYLQCGSLVLALSPEELPHLQKLYENGIANGVPGIRLLSAEETFAMEPNLAPTVVGALYAPSAAGASEVATASIFSLIMFSFEECVMHVACVQAAANHDNAISSNHCTHGIDTHRPMFQIPAPCPGSSLVFVVGLMGIEPTTFCSGDRRSIH